MTIAFWICAAVTVVSSLVSAGYAVVGVRSAAEAARMPSEYALSRSIALVVVAISAMFVANVGFTAAAAIVMILVQAGDAIVGARARDRFKTIGPAATAVANAAALVWLLAS